MKRARIDEVVTRLTSTPRSLEEATGAGGLPGKPGFYAWWALPGSIPDVPCCPHPALPDLDLLYVGISPSSAKSSQNLRKRVAGHINGNTGGSTFRLTLASLLFETMGWKPVMTDRLLLTRDDNRALTAWQHEHLRVTWADTPEPWAIEHDVIAGLQPPLNLAGNGDHPFAATLSAARRRFKKHASADPL